MNGNSYLADTNCFIYLLDEHPLLEPFTESKWAYSYITHLELLSKKALTTKQDTLIRQVLSACQLVNHNSEIGEIAIRLRRKYGVKLPDAVIAASAMYMEFPILTADKGLSAIKELDIVLIEL